MRHRVYILHEIAMGSAGQVFAITTWPLARGLVTTLGPSVSLQEPDVCTATARAGVGGVKDENKEARGFIIFDFV